MKKASASHDNLGTFPTQKGWSSERVPLPTRSGQRRISGGSGGAASVMALNGGRTLPSKWEDAERWICSPVLGYGDGNKSTTSHAHHAQQRRPKSKSGPIEPPGAVYYSNYSPANPAFETGSVRNFTIGSPFSTGVLAADCVSLHYGSGGGGGGRLGRSTSVLGLSELHNEKLDDNTMCEEQAISRAVSQRDMGTQISPKGCHLHSSPERRQSFAPSSPTLLSIVEEQQQQQQRDHFAKLEVREVQVDNRATVVMESNNRRRTGDTSRVPPDPDVNDLYKFAVEDQASSWNIAEATMNTSRLQREEAKITAWENSQKAKAEAALRKLELKLEKKRSSTMDKIMKKMRKSQVKAHKMRSSVPLKYGHQVPKTSAKVPSFSKHVQMGCLSRCYTCDAF